MKYYSLKKLNTEIVKIKCKGNDYKKIRTKKRREI